MERDIKNDLTVVMFKQIRGLVKENVLEKVYDNIKLFLDILNFVFCRMFIVDIILELLLQVLLHKVQYNIDTRVLQPDQKRIAYHRDML